ncbi:hypothetical protein BH18ACT1_BH18ACT1_01900 [soil metagenome]
MIAALTAAVLGAVLAGCGPAPSERTYYVSSTGSDSASGTSPGSAWRTIAKVNAANLEPGDRVLFRGGASYPGSLYLSPDDGGTAAEPVTLSSYEGTATIAAGGGTGIFAYRVGGITVSNLSVVGAGRTANAGSGIAFYNDLTGDVLLGGIRISDVSTSGFRDYGVSLGGGAGRSGYRDVRIEQLRTFDNGASGLLTFAAAHAVHQNVYVGRSEAFRNTGRPEVTFNTGSGIVLGSVAGATIEHNYAHDNGGLNQFREGPVGIWTYDATRVVIQFNRSYANNTGVVVDGGGFNLDQNVTASTMQYNHSRGNDGPGFLLAQRWATTAHSGNTVRYNISEDDARKGSGAGILVWGAVRNAKILHNTVFLGSGTSSGVRAVRVSNPGRETSDTASVHVRNNLFFTRAGVPLVEATATQLDGSTDLRFEGNDWYGEGGTTFAWGSTSYSSLSGWRSGTGQARVGSTAVGLSVNPQLVAAGTGTEGSKLQSGSPLVDAGLDVASAGARDYFGNAAARGVAPDVGAHELR